jgi:hypothetical protein
MHPSCGALLRKSLLVSSLFEFALLLGALMLDVLLLLIAMAAGLLASLGGFFLSLTADIPASSGVGAVSVLLLIASRIALSGAAGNCFHTFDGGFCAANGKHRRRASSHHHAAILQAIPNAW